MPSPNGPNPNLNNIKPKKPAAILPWNNGHWGPAGWFRYKVRYGDNWWTLAHKDGWSDPWDLIEYNFKTRNAREVNWYLRHFVGCTHTSPDGKNHVFTDNLKPGYVYTVRQHQPQEQVPPVPARLPWPDQAGDDGIKLARPGTWYGIGWKSGAMVGVGLDLTTAVMFDASFTEAHKLDATAKRLGGGGGFGTGPVLVIATGIHRLSDLRHCILDSMDWNFSIGMKMRSLADIACNFGEIKTLAQSVRAGLFARTAISNGATVLKGITSTRDIEYGGKVSVTVIDLPIFSLGAEISLFGSSTTFDVRPLWQGLQDVDEQSLVTASA